MNPYIIRKVWHEEMDSLLKPKASVLISSYIFLLAYELYVDLCRVVHKGEKTILYKYGWYYKGKGDYMYLNKVAVIIGILGAIAPVIIYYRWKYAVKLKHRKIVLKSEMLS